MASAVEQAVRRFEAALQSLEIAIQQRLSQSEGAEGLSAEVEMLAADRAGLAESLDQSQARVVKLESLNREVSKRVGQAVETIRAVLQSETERQ
jgi:Domain of unknown function (DUF4164)